MGVSKVIFGGNELINLTADTVKADVLLSNYTAHGADGEQIVGTCTYDSNTYDADIKVGEMLIGKTAYARGTKLTGDMANNEDYSALIQSVNEVVNIPVGFHDGSGTVKLDPEKIKNLLAENIKQGKEILGVTGTMTGKENIKVEETKTITPTMVQQTIAPSIGYDYMSEVIVKPIPFETSNNTGGGITYTIG